MKGMDTVNLKEKILQCKKKIDKVALREPKTKNELRNR